MVRPFPHYIVATPTTHHCATAALSVTLFVFLTALVTLCAKRAKNPSKTPNEPHLYADANITPKLSPLATPKRLFSNIGNKAKKGNSASEMGATEEGGVWQKNILMGEKCQPLEFSGVIYYDNFGNRISEIPRSPRHSATGMYGGLSFPRVSMESS